LRVFFTEFVVREFVVGKIVVQKFVPNPSWKFVA